MPLATPGEGQILLDGMIFTLAKQMDGSPGQLQVQELGTFPRKITIGDPGKDSQDFLSTWIISDLTGGHGLADHQTDATISRYRYATMDVTKPNMWTQRSKVNTETGTAGAFWPAGDLLVSGNVEMYGVFGTDLHLWTEATDTWTDTTRNLSAAPVNCGVAFAGTGTLRLFIPMGTTGYATDTGAAITNVATSGSTPGVRDFAILGTMLIALDTNNQLWFTVDGTAWTSFGADGKIDGSFTAYRLDHYRDALGNPSLIIATSGGTYVFDPAGPTLYDQDLQYPMHPDQGLAACEWRGIYYVSVGMGIHSYNSGTGTIDAMGLDRDEGLPYLYNYNSRIVDLEPAYNEMYALVQGSTADSTRPSVHRWTGKGWHAVWEHTTTATVTRLYVSQARSTYRVWWGGGNNSYTMELPRGYTNPKQMSVNLSTNLLDTTGYVETGLTDMGMAGYRKIAHSARVRIAYLNAAHGTTIPTLGYRLRDEDAYTTVYSWTQVFSADPAPINYQTYHYAFGGSSTDATGVGFDEIELKLTVPDQYGIVKFMAMDFIKVPKLNKSWTAVIDMTASSEVNSPSAMQTKINALINAETICELVHRGTTYWVHLASWTGADNTGKGDDRSMRTIQIIETRFTTTEDGTYLS
jgi:hypothetical protein